MKKIALFTSAVVVLLGSALSITWLAAYKKGRCDYARLKYEQTKQDLLKQQDEFCFTIRARLGGEDAIVADKVCKKWLQETVEPELDKYISEELKKDSCN